MQIYTDFTACHVINKQIENSFEIWYFYVIDFKFNKQPSWLLTRNNAFIPCWW